MPQDEDLDLAVRTSPLGSRRSIPRRTK